MVHDTIAAISTAPGEAAISVIRVSGKDAIRIASAVFKTRGGLEAAPARSARLGRVVDGEGTAVDHGLAIVFRAPHSYTGEDAAELHCHGGVLVTQRVLALLLQNGARQADAGEFTQRAFLNGKMDLTQAEAVMDLIHAHSTLALRAANEQLEGVIGSEAEAMRKELIEVLAHIEAFIDFPDEDISPETGSALIARIGAIQQRAARLLSTSEHGRILRSGARTVICGAPNAGKSSLLNLLVGFERAIVSPTAGTTRDTIEEYIQVHGLPLRLVDTAGLRESADEIERHGITRAGREIERADLVIEVVDASAPPPDAGSRAAEAAGMAAERRILVLNKSDLPRHPAWSTEAGISLSCETRQGVEELRSAIRDRLMRDSAAFASHPVAINARHKACFETVAARLEAAAAGLRDEIAPEFVALEMREALQAIGEVVGQADIEEVLDVIFSSFCIGK
jgi:tRNA modification GTPase